MNSIVRPFIRDVYKRIKVVVEKDDYLEMIDGKPFSGIHGIGNSKVTYVNGRPEGLTTQTSTGKIRTCTLNSNWEDGYLIDNDYDSLYHGGMFAVYDAGALVEHMRKFLDEEGIFHASVFNNEEYYNEWQEKREEMSGRGFYAGGKDFMPFYHLQNEIRDKARLQDERPADIKYLAGVDVAYNELELRMVAAVTIHRTDTLEVVGSATHEIDLDFAYMPAYYSFREAPVVLTALSKISIQPDIIICNSHGASHPQGAGLATHLGVTLDIPAMGCSAKRLIGTFETPGTKRGEYSPLIWLDKPIGRVLRTHESHPCLFVSAGHKISVETASDWMIRLTGEDRFPVVIKAAVDLVNTVLSERTELDIFQDLE